MPEPRVRQLDTEAHEGAVLAEGVPEEGQQSGALLEYFEQRAVCIEIVAAGLAEKVRRAADEQSMLLGPCGIGERGPEELDECLLALGEARLAERPPQGVGAEWKPGRALVQVLRGPGDKARVDRVPEREHALRHSARRGDHDGHDDLRLQREYLDVAH